MCSSDLIKVKTLVIGGELFWTRRGGVLENLSASARHASIRSSRESWRGIIIDRERLLARKQCFRAARAYSAVDSA